MATHVVFVQSVSPAIRNREGAPRAARGAVRGESLFRIEAPDKSKILNFKNGVLARPRVLFVVKAPQEGKKIKKLQKS